MILNSDSIKCTEDEATELCIHHLNLAGLFFEMSPDDNNEALMEELERKRKQNGGYREPWMEAAVMFIGSLLVNYEGMKKEQSE